MALIALPDNADPDPFGVDREVHEELTLCAETSEARVYCSAMRTDSGLGDVIGNNEIIVVALLDFEDVEIGEVEDIHNGF